MANEQPKEKDWTRRDQLVATERSIQAIQDYRIVRDRKKEKYMATFPYAYMNGRLHLGHSFTIAQVEFMSRYKRLLGEHVLFPFGFHGTGMPIVACAQKLREELTSGTRTGHQATTLLKMGVTDDQLDSFTDPKHWLSHWPAVAKEDLRVFGLSADMSRSFVTTDMNPHYDSFVRWQFERLHQGGKLFFGKKPIVYSPKDGQPCADHDRSVGEGIGLKEYTVLSLFLEEYNVHLLAATTRPETFYAATNLWISSKINYIIFSQGNTRYVSTEWGYKNLRHQIEGETIVVGTVSGSELIGKELKIDVMTLPLWDLDVDPEKGTGIVVSVPGHSVSDYRNFKKAGGNMLRISSAIVLEDGRRTADIIKTDLEKGVPPAQVSKKIYKLECESGTMITGLYQGMLCTEALKKLQVDIPEQEMGFRYWEPDGIVISRSGDRCIGALIEQWFINYGDEEWTKKVNDWIMTMETGSESVREQLLKTSNWIHEWPCSRSFGLGTQLLDTEYIIDSLSDSTIYMAYYTIAHLIGQIPAEKLSYDLWEHIFRDGPLPPDLDEHQQVVAEMREEFKYWYPIDLRVSAKDLVGNHLVMAIYNHVEIWSDPKMWPKAYHINGYTLLNGEKMSKSTGNFMTLRGAVDKYGADATRLAIAEAGASIDDSNFNEDNADKAVLRLSTEVGWCLEQFAKLAANSKGSHQETFWDKVFRAEIDFCIDSAKTDYNAMDYRAAVVEGFHGLLAARDDYRVKVKDGIIAEDMDLIRRYLEVHLALIYPICPHYSEHLWSSASALGISLNRSYPQIQTDYRKVIWYRDGFKNCLNSCNSTYERKCKQHRKKPDAFNLDDLVMTVTMYPRYSDVELDLLDRIQQLLKKGKDWKEITTDLMQTGDKKNLGRFCAFVRKNIEKYGQDWFDWVRNSDEVESVQTWIPKLITGFTGEIRFEIKEGTAFKTYPWNSTVSLR